MASIVVVGSSNTDLTVSCPELPRPGQTVMGERLYTAAGGKGANQAVAAARAGASVSFVGAIGDDDFGRSALAGFRADGIDTSHVVVKKRVPSGVALILVDESSENLIAVAPGANAKLTVADVNRAAAAIRRADVLLLQLEIPLPCVQRAAAIARRAGVRVVLNPAPMPAEPLPPGLLSSVDVIVPNSIELRRLGRKELFALGVKGLIVTMGAKGVRIVTPNRNIMVPAFRVRAVDTVGAGDCFCGYLAAALAEGRKLEDAVRLGCAAAAISVTRRGAQPSMPHRSEVERCVRRANKAASSYNWPAIPMQKTM